MEGEQNSIPIWLVNNKIEEGIKSWNHIKIQKKRRYGIQIIVAKKENKCLV